MLRRTLLAAASSDRLRQAVTTGRQTRAIVDRYVAGETTADAVRAARDLRAAGLLVSLDYLGEDTADVGQAADVTSTYIELLGALSAATLTAGGGCEVSVKATAVGLFLTRARREDRDGEHRADLRRGPRRGDHRHAGRRGPHGGRRYPPHRRGAAIRLP